MRTIEGVEVDWNETLWRYCMVERFQWVVDNGRMYFASANEFEDPFEGAVAVPDKFTAAGSALRRDGERRTCFLRTQAADQAELLASRGVRERRYVEALCRATQRRCPLSTPDRMRRAFQPFRLQPDYGVEDLWAGPVAYVDLTKIRMRCFNMERFFFKHRAFEWEREFRLAISMAMAEQFAVPVPERGIEVGVDLNILVDRIIVGPEIPAAQRDHVAALAKSAGFEDRLRFSSLLGLPRYI